eukprot:Rhum_TRINITY_DN15489_c3_g10::Rhum_TRINITY_DN15489_c3_g10_i1::g.159388::m.159388
MSETRGRSRSKSPEVHKDPKEHDPLARALWHLPRHLYLKRRNLTLAVGSWNVQGASPSALDEPVAKWAHAKRAVDVAVLGMQEVRGRTKGDWADRVTREMLSHDFVTVAARHKAGLWVAVFCKKWHADAVRNAAGDNKRVNGAFAGKGALAVRFTVYSKRFLFINCHFDHNLKSSAKRNLNFKSVLHEIDVGPPRNACADATALLTEQGGGTRGPVAAQLPPPAATSSPPRAPSPPASPLGSDDEGGAGCDGSGSGGEDEADDSSGDERQGSGGGAACADSAGGGSAAPALEQSTIGCHDYIFWFGDLNYRVSADTDDVLRCVARRRWAGILQFDQLRIALSEHPNLFPGFAEPEINFPPTYKFFRGRNEYDCSKRSGVRRVPSYPDRVLYRCLPAGLHEGQFLDAASNLVAPLKYKHYPEQTLSDHRPIAAVFAVAAYEEVPEALSRVRDMALAGVSTDAMAKALADEAGVPACPSATAELLYAPLEEHDDTAIGEGTVYSSDEDEESLALKQQRKMERAIAAMEAEVRARRLGDGARRGEEAAALAGAQAAASDALDAAAAGAASASLLYRRQLGCVVAAQRAVDGGGDGDAAASVADPLADAGNAEFRRHSVEYVGEMCANAVGRVERLVDAAHERRRQRRLAAGGDGDGDGGGAAGALVDPCAAAVAAAAAAVQRQLDDAVHSLCVTRGLPPSAQPPPSPRARAAFYAGFLAGGSSSSSSSGDADASVRPPCTPSSPPSAAAAAAEAALAQREAAVRARERRTEDGLRRAAGEEAALMARLRDVERQAQEAAAGGDAGDDADRAGWSETQLEDELRLLQHRAVLKRQSLGVATLRAAEERDNACRAAAVAARERDVGCRMHDAALMAAHLSALADGRPPVRTRAATSPQRAPPVSEPMCRPYPGGGGGALPCPHTKRRGSPPKGAAAGAGGGTLLPQPTSSPPASYYRSGSSSARPQTQCAPPRAAATLHDDATACGGGPGFTFMALLHNR